MTIVLKQEYQIIIITIYIRPTASQKLPLRIRTPTADWALYTDH